MPGSSTNGVPYALPGDNVADWPATSQAVADALDPWTYKGRCVVYQSGATTSVPNNTPTPVAFHAVVMDQGDLWTSGSRVTIKVPGVYEVYGQLGFASAGGSPAGYRECQLARNGSGLARDRDTPVVSASSVLSARMILECAAGDYLELLALHTQGADLATVSGQSWTRLEVVYLGPA